MLGFFRFRNSLCGIFLLIRIPYLFEWFSILSGIELSVVIKGDIFFSCYSVLACVFYVLVCKDIFFNKDFGVVAFALLVGFYDISYFIGYLMPNSFSYE